MFHNHEEYKAYIQGKLEEIKRFQQEESKKRRYQLTDNEAALEWIDRHAEEYNRQWTK